MLGLSIGVPSEKRRGGRLVVLEAALSAVTPWRLEERNVLSVVLSARLRTRISLVLDEIYTWS